MAYQHREFRPRLGDAERLRLYAQSAISDQKALSASLMEMEASSQCWESEANEAIKRVVRAEAERDVARHEATMARLDVEVVGSGRAQGESELAKVQHALAALEDARQKGEFELTRVQTPWLLQKRLGEKRRTRPTVWQMNEFLYYWSSGLAKTSCPLSG